MLLNSSSFYNYYYNYYYYCSSSKDTQFITAGMITAKTVLVLFLCTFILYMGFQRWRQHHCKKAATHSELFTYHLAAMELFWGFGSLFHAFGNRINAAIIVVAYCCFIFTFYAEALFHLLTCAKWYLAVVHPLIYRSSKNACGVMIRNMSIRSVWVMSAGMMSFHLQLNGGYVLISVLCISIVSLVVITFCSISILRVLIRPQTDKTGGKSKRVSQSNLRAFQTVTAISCVLWLWFGGLFVFYALSMSPLLSQKDNCVMVASIFWLNLPTFLVSPLLYLHGERKLFCNCYKPK